MTLSAHVHWQGRRRPR